MSQPQLCSLPARFARPPPAAPCPPAALPGLGRGESVAAWGWEVGWCCVMICCEVLRAGGSVQSCSARPVAFCHQSCILQRAKHLLESARGFSGDHRRTAAPRIQLSGSYPGSMEVDGHTLDGLWIRPMEAGGSWMWGVGGFQQTSR